MDVLVQDVESRVDVWIRMGRVKDVEPSGKPELDQRKSEAKGAACDALLRLFQLPACIVEVGAASHCVVTRHTKTYRDSNLVCHQICSVTFVKTSFFTTIGRRCMSIFYNQHACQEVKRIYIYIYK